MSQSGNDDLTERLARLQQGEVDTQDDERADEDDQAGDVVDFGGQPPVIAPSPASQPAAPLPTRGPVRQPAVVTPQSLANARAAAASQRISPGAHVPKPAIPVRSGERIQSSAVPAQVPTRVTFDAPESAALATDEDDATLVPAASEEYLARPAARPVARAPVDRSFERRRTLIPILLTLGVLLPLIAAQRWLADAASPLAAMPGWLVGLLIAAGVLLLALAGLNMTLVRRTTSARGLQV